MIPTRYREMLSAPGVARLLACGTLAKLPAGVDGLAIVLLVHQQHGSFALAGSAAGAYALGMGAGNPLQGRLWAKYGPFRVLVGFAAAYVVAVSAFIVCELADAPLIAGLGSACVVGAATPTIASGIRAALVSLLRGQEELQLTAYALNAVATELSAIAGPLLTAAATAVVSPAAALACSATIVLACTMMALRAIPVSAFRQQHRPAARGPTIVARDVGCLLMIMMLAGACLAATEIGLAGFASATGAPALAGVLIAAESVASLVAGLVYGARARAAGAMHVWLLGIWAIGTALLSLAGQALSMGLLLLLPGIAFAPMMTELNRLTGRVASGRSSVVLFTWTVTAWTLGASTGAAVAGGLLHASGWQSTLLAAAGAASIATACAWLSRPVPMPASELSADGQRPERDQRGTPEFS